MRKTLQALLCAAAVTPALLLAACETEEAPVEPIDAAAVSGTAVENLRTIGTGAAEASDFAWDSELLGFSREVADAGACAPDAIDCVEEDPMDGTSLRDAVQEAADFLAEHVFVESNVESATATSVTYRLRPETFCDGGEIGQQTEGDPGSDVPPPPDGGDLPPPDGGDVSPPDDSGTDDCTQMLTDVPIRLVVSSPAQGDIDVELLVGDARANPVDFRLYRGEIGLSVDLAGVKAAILELAAAMGEDVPELPDVMTGVIDVFLRRNAPQDFTIAVSVLEAVEVADSDPRFSVRVDVSEPLAQVRLDGAGRTATFTANLGAVDLEAPLDDLWGSGDYVCAPTEPGMEPMPCEEPAPLVGTLAVHLGGASGEVVYDGSQDRITVTNVGLGDTTTTATLDGQPLFALDLNPDAGRRLDVTAEKVTGGVGVTVNPSLDVALSLDGATIADQTDDVPAWAMNEDLRVTLDGDAAPRIVLLDAMGDDTLPGPGIEQIDSVVRIEAGRLTLSASSLVSPVVVEAGQCLNHAETGPLDGGLESGEEPHPFAEVSGGACQ